VGEINQPPQTLPIGSSISEKWCWDDRNNPVDAKVSHRISFFVRKPFPRVPPTTSILHSPVQTLSNLLDSGCETADQVLYKQGVFE
jgi:hypothetical protein